VCMVCVTYKGSDDIYEQPTSVFALCRFSVAKFFGVQASAMRLLSEDGNVLVCHCACFALACPLADNNSIYDWLIEDTEHAWVVDGLCTYELTLLEQNCVSSPVAQHMPPSSSTSSHTSSSMDDTVHLCLGSTCKWHLNRTFFPGVR
jgi:hypothetical protein